MKIKKLRAIIGKMFSSRKRAVISLFIISISVILIAALTVLYLNKKNDSSDLPNTKGQVSEQTEGPGGDAKIVLDYYKKAVSAYKAGDKEKAKTFAEKAIEEKKKLTAQQENTLQDQNNINYALYDIQRGSYNDGE